jgi:hypothetical protein
MAEGDARCLGEFIKVLFFGACYPTFNGLVKGVAGREGFAAVGSFFGWCVAVFAGFVQVHISCVFGFSASFGNKNELRVFIFPAPFLSSGGGQVDIFRDGKYILQ